MPHFSAMGVAMMNSIFFLLILLPTNCTFAFSPDTQSGDRSNISVTSRADHSIVPASDLARNLTFSSVVYVSLLNAVVNFCRPDPDIIWQARLPRILWEVCIASTAAAASASVPSICLLLSLMTVSTALIDIFIWAPAFSMFASFETCHGGGLFSRQPRVCTSDYVKGIGRIFVSVQSLLTGVFYLLASVVSWGAFTDARDARVARQNAAAMADAFTAGNKMRFSSSKL